MEIPRNAEIIRRVFLSFFLFKKVFLFFLKLFDWIGKLYIFPERVRIKTVFLGLKKLFKSEGSLFVFFATVRLWKNIYFH